MIFFVYIASNLTGTNIVITIIDVGEWPNILSFYSSFFGLTITDGLKIWARIPKLSLFIL